MLVELTQENLDRDKSIVDNSKDHVMMAMYLLEDNPNMVTCQDTIYNFNGKCYDLLSEKDLDSLYLKFCMRYGITKVAWKNINSVIRAMVIYPSIKNITKMNDYDNLLCLNNGVLNIHTKEFEPHNPKYYFDSFINVDYNTEDTNCPNFIKYLEHTFNGDKETIENIIRLGGYLLDTSCAAKRMFMFNGPGGSGKSTLIDTFSMFFVESMDYRNQITSLSLQELASGGFDKEILINSRFNQCAETKKEYVDAEQIKKMISGDIIKVSRKFKIPVNFRPKMKIIVACNGLPKFNDTSDGIYRRLQIIEFENQYKRPQEFAWLTNTTLRKIYIGDEGLMDKIKLEKVAILNLFIEGLVALRKDNYSFHDSGSSERALNEFKKDSDTVREFLEESYEVDADSKTPLRYIYNYYRDWYRLNVQDMGVMKFRINEMGKRVAEVFGVKSLGQEFLYSSEMQKSIRETMYPIKLKDQEPPEEHILTPEEAYKQTGLNFNKE
jgi:putative DNA primase/helicase